jgi:hypothetical protein
MIRAELDNSDLRLMELARRNPSLGGRELLLEVIERGPMPEENERPQVRDIRSALKRRGIDDPDYRTRPQQADWIGAESQTMRDLYERGAEIRGEVLTIPADEYELPQNHETPFITTLSYALGKLGDAERAQEFHSLALAISGETADARMQIAVFKHYYDRIRQDVRSNSFGRERSDVLKRTLDEMRSIAAEMAKLETKESIEAFEAEKAREGTTDEERQVESFGDKISVAARKINLRDEALRFPAELSYETKERVVSKTIPEIDRRLESGVHRGSLFKAIDNTFFRAVSSDLTNGEWKERSKTATFLKGYIDERLCDPETRALNTSALFREARAAIISAATPEALGRNAASILRANERRSEELRRHRADPNRYPPPEVIPLNLWERKLLFNGRAPEHHTREMRDLRLHYGLSRVERIQRIVDLRENRVEPSNVLRTMLQELDSRRTAKAVAHFQASILNEQISETGKINLFQLSQQLAPHERAYLFELSEERKKGVQRSPHIDRTEGISIDKKDEGLSGRSFGEAPRESLSFRAYMANMGRIERQLLNEAVGRLNPQSGHEKSDLTITEARGMLPEKMRDEIRLQARNLAWQHLIPEEVFDREPLPEALHISDTIAHLQEQLQERARTALIARNDFVAEKTRLAEEHSRSKSDNQISFTTRLKGREVYTQSVLAALSPDAAHKLVELNRYTVKTREEVYRGFELLDAQFQALEQARARKIYRSEETANLHSFTLQTLDGRSTNAHLEFQASLIDHSHLNANSQSKEHSAHKSGVAMANHQAIYVESNQEWHFDDLREVLNVGAREFQSDSYEREDWQHYR